MKRTLFFTFLLLAALGLTTVAAAQVEIEWVKAYDASLGEYSEGIAVDSQGNIYVSMVPLGQVRKINSRTGAETTLYQFPLGTGVAGLAVDAANNVYAGVVSTDPAIHGVWKIDRRGRGAHLPGSEAIGMPPNGLAFDPSGNLWVTDSWVLGTEPPNAQGSVWRIPPSGKAELWYRDVDTLGGLGEIEGYAPIGANGIAYYHRALYVANTERGHIVRIPILPHGGPGQPEVLWADTDLLMIDGITMNSIGSIFAAIIGQDQIVAICGITGQLAVLAVGGPIDGPASVTFGAGRDSMNTLYFTNYAVLSGDEAQPGILKMNLNWPPWADNK